MAGHTASMVLRSQSAGFVGRAAELARLEHALGRAARGAPTTVLLGGDAGVGKTRLVEEFARRARERGARVLTGGCLEMGDGGLPYSAVTEVLRELTEVVGLPELRRLAGENARELQRLAPRLQPVDQPAGEGSGIALDASSQLRLFEALLSLVGRLAADGPLVVVLEDMHWADASTRDLLAFLAHNLREVPVVVTVTYRTDDLHRQHPLRPVLGRLLRSESVERVDLAPFERDEVSQLVEGILGDTPGPELLEQVFERSQGNAFFAEELVAAGEARGADLPDSLREVLLVAIDGLPAGVVEVLRVVAAAGGGAVRHDLITNAAALASNRPGGGDLDERLRVAVERGVLVADAAAGTYAFRHALLSEAVYSTLLPGEVGRLHSALARAIEADPGLASRSAAAELAHHWQVALDQPRALSASLEAAREAEAVTGVAEARRHVERILELWAHVEDVEERTGMDLPALTRWAAELSYLAGDPARAVALQEQALAYADADPADRAVMLERLGRFLWVAGDDERAEAAYEQALGQMPPDPPSAERARVLSSYSQILMLDLRMAESDRFGKEALAMAREVGARSVEGHALANLGTNLGARGDEHGLELLRQARAIGEEQSAADDIMRSYMNESHVLARLGRFDAVIDLVSAALERARELGVAPLWGAGLANNLADAALLVGRWDLADEVLRTAPRDTGGIGAAWAHLARADLLTGRGDVAQARTELDAARRARAHENPQSTYWFLRVRLSVALLDDDRDEVRELVEGRPTLDDPDEAGAIQLREVILRALADGAMPGRWDRSLADQVLSECHSVQAKLGHEDPHTCTWVALAEAEHARAVAGPDRAERWTTVLNRCDEFGLAYYAAYARYRLAEALLADGARDAVADLVHAAHRTALDLGAQPLLAEVVGLARRARLALGLEPAASPADDLGLTPREAEVLALVAEGQTNREIATELYISVKTASVHVSNILRKLEVSNRGEAAALAHRLGFAAE
jgi:DNA-binding CsgD family transcriptional regulator/tetratricopeptide (TPR) repeat protein